MQEAICEIERKANTISQTPFLALNISLTSLVALYDTGADVYCISKAAFNAIPKHLQPTNLNASKKGPMFRAANDDMINTLGKYNLKF